MVNFFRNFDDFEVFIFWTVQEGPGRLLGGVLGGSWGVLRGSGGVRGASWETLGRSWSGLGGHLVARRFLIDFWSDFGVVLGAQKGPRGNQNGTKSGPKSKAKTMPKKVASQDPLRAVLGRSLGILEAILGSEKAFSYLKNQYGNKIHVFHEDKHSRGILV